MSEGTLHCQQRQSRPVQRNLR
ncbi:hypothetical protein PM8797T_21223 [Gimesia maris DSM 8797]|nr:hypothetical protein PM8797T_21223 [Gimesia maris DSM 8797]